jgi:hypothetical protein
MLAFLESCCLIVVDSLRIKAAIRVMFPAVFLVAADEC